MLKILSLIFLCFVLTPTVFAQNESWFNGSFSFGFKNNFSTRVELIHRRKESEFTNNPFEKANINAFRPWIEYSHLKHRFSVSPLTLFEYQAQNSISKRKLEERVSIAHLYKLKLTQKWIFTQRNTLEYRNFKNSSENTWRIRNQFLFQYNINTSWRVKTSVENLISFTPSFDAFKVNQTRLALEGEYQLTPKIKLASNLQQIHYLTTSSHRYIGVISFLVKIELGNPIP